MKSPTTTTKAKTLPITSKEAGEAMAKSMTSVVEADRTGKLLEQMDPDTAAEALFRLACKGSKTAIAKELGIDRGTLRQLESRHPTVLGLLRQRSANMAASAADKALELVHRKLDQLDKSPDQLENTGFKDLCLGTAIMVDKSRLLGGESTLNVAHEHTRATIEQSMAEIRRANAAVEVKAVNVDEAE